MLVIRLNRLGTKNKPIYRLMVQEKRSKKDGRAIDSVGFWNPVKNLFKIDKEKLDKWVKVGAQISPAVKKLLK